MPRLPHRSLRPIAPARPWRRGGLLLASLLLGAIAGSAGASAAWAQSAPAEVTTLLDGVDRAASLEDEDAVLEFYSPDFRSSDGLTRQTLSQALRRFWAEYDSLTYATRIESWERENGAIVVETATDIAGVNNTRARNLKLQAEVRARQTLRDGAIVAQEILAERVQVVAGDRPPTVDVRLPEAVRPGEDFAFDAIVEEPLGNDILLGAVLEEDVAPGGYLDPTSLDLQPLSAGGLFKIGRAPDREGDRWVSAILVSGDGLTLITRRLRVER